jgi:superfamily II DNA/RNA helicase
VDFHDDPATRVLFATDAGGVGLNLQRAANCCVNVELPWNPAVLEQRIGRIHRMGQRRPIDVYNLVTQDSIEARIAALVSDKRAFFKGLFDSASNEVRFERSASFLSRIHAIVAPARPAALPAAAEADDEPESVLAAEAEAAVADDPRDVVEPAAQAPAAPTPEGLRQLFSSLDIRPQPNGHLRIDAPPEAAAMLATLFESMAGLLRRAADTPERPGKDATGA